jgi:hypothetical protein
MEAASDSEADECSDEHHDQAEDLDKDHWLAA